MKPFREDLRDLVTKHVAREAPLGKLLQFAQMLEEEPPIYFGKSESKPVSRFTLIAADGSQWMDPQDGEHVATYDAKTNLTWLAGPVEGGERPWQESMDAASKVRLFGFTDWRAPTIEEQLSIIDYTRFDPAVDTDCFKGPFGWTWTSTVAKSPSDYAWLVGLNDGYSSRYHQTNHGYVRAVRAGQPLGLGL